jgi:hypothetical protein
MQEVNDVRLVFAVSVRLRDSLERLAQRNERSPAAELRSIIREAAAKIPATPGE